MRKSLIALTFFAAGASAMLIAPATAAPSARSAPAVSEKPLRVIGLVDGTSFVSFTTNNPGQTTSLGTITGLSVDTSLVGIDFRVADGRLYGVGNAGGIYQFERNSSAGRLLHRLTVALDGSSFGVDFNPSVNALRIVSDTGQNLRQSFNLPFPATANDARLSTAPISGTTFGVTAAAYTNNDKDARTGTTLYGLNTQSDAVVIQSPANAGTLAPTGSLTVDASADAGFDIYSVIREGSTVELRAHATLVVNGARGLYDVTLFNGRATLMGALSANVTDLAFPLNQI